MPGLKTVLKFVRSLGKAATVRGVGSAVVKDVFKLILDEGEELLTGSEYLETLRDKGVQIRTETFYQIYNDAKDKGYYRDVQEEYPEDEAIGRSDMGWAPFNARAPYVYAVTLEMEGEGEYKGGSRFFYMRSDVQLSKSQVLSEYVARYESEFEGQGVNWDSLKFAGAWKGRLPRG
jgi:hypothetical protein